MEEKIKFGLNQAKAIADKYVDVLSPFCDRIAIAGSIRREKPLVKDIEIVCIPTKMEIFDLFGEVSELVYHPDFVKTVGMLPKVKGAPTGKYTQRDLPEGIKLDLFIANPNNWGNIFAMRTGSAEYSDEILGKGWVRKGYKSIDGFICSDGKPINLHEEEDLFELIGVPYIEPKNRNI